MSAPFIVREAVQEDFPDVVGLVCAVAERAFSLYGSEADVRRWQQQVPPRWNALAGRDDALVVVACSAGEIIATGFVEQRGEVAYFGGAYSAREHGGAGAEIVRRRLGWARSRPGVTSVLADVFADGDSPRFWLPLGLGVVGEYSDQVFPGTRMLKLGAPIALVRDPA